METRLLTAARLPFSRIGLGCVTFGREIDEAASFALLDHALARGVTLYDTAAAYGQGASETILGRWLASRRPEGITVATKIAPPYDFSEVEDSLARLGVERIDLLFLHSWHPDAASPATLGALDALVRGGKVAAVAASNFTEEQLRASLEAQRQRGFARFGAVQNNHNLAVSEIDAGYRDYCAANEVAVVTYSPLGAGFLTGKHGRGREAAAGSRFEIIPGHQRVYFHEDAFRRLAGLENVAARAGLPQARLALAWALHQPGIASVLVGGRTTTHLDQAFEALACDEPGLFADLDLEE